MQQGIKISLEFLQVCNAAFTFLAYFLEKCSY